MADYSDVPTEALRSAIQLSRGQLIEASADVHRLRSALEDAKERALKLSAELRDQERALRLREPELGGAYDHGEFTYQSWRVGDDWEYRIVDTAIVATDDKGHVDRYGVLQDVTCRGCGWRRDGMQISVQDALEFGWKHWQAEHTSTSVEGTS